MKRLLIVELMAVALLTMLAGLGFHRVFADTDYLVPVLGAALFGVALSAGAQWRRLSVTPAVTASVLGFIVWAMYSVLFDTMPNGVPTGSTITELAAGMAGGWAEILSTTLPARPEPGLLLVASFVIWAAGAASAELAGRRDSVIGPMIGPLLALTVTLFIGASGPETNALLSAGFAALALVTILIHVSRVPASRLLVGPTDRPDTRPQNEQSPNRRMLSGLPLVVLAAALGSFIVAQLPLNPDDAFDPRSLRKVQIEQRLTSSPIVSVKAQLTADPPVPVFGFDTARLGDLDEVDSVKLVTLERFTGAVWTSDATYSKVGTVLPSAEDGPSGDLEQRTISQTYTIQNLPGPWLPVVGRPISVSSEDSELLVRFDDRAGSVLSETGALSDLEYEVVSDIPVITDDDREFAQRSTADGLEVYTELPDGLPDSIRALALDKTSETISPYEQLQALEAFFLEEFRYSTDVEPGHSYARVERFLTERKIGYSEQFASSFAIMARSLGFPSRVVIGYQLTSSEEAGGAVGSRTEVTSDQLHIWPEVFLDKVGWVNFNPTPTNTAPFVPANDEPVATQGGEYVLERARPRVVGPGLGNLSTPDPGLLSGPLLSVAIALGGLVLLLAMLIILKVLRRRSRRTGLSPTDQILGAWAEVADRLLELGVGVPDSQTAKEVASTNAAVLGPAPTARLNAMIPLVTTAIYAPHEPTDLDAEEMWTHVRAFRQELYAERTKFTEAMAFLNPRPFFSGR